MSETTFPTLREIYRRRAEAAKKESPLVATFRAAMLVWDTLKADGVDEAVRVQTLSRSLQEVWPQTRPWKYLCNACNDYGLVIHACHGDATCGVEKPHLPHEFGEPCWCSNGAKFRAKPKPTAEDFTAAGRTTKPTRVGR